MPARFNARAAWAALDADQQRRVGELMLVAYHASVHAGVRTKSVPWEHAGVTAITMLLPDLPWSRDALPDLAALGIRACRVCGCTDLSACAGGCSWVGDDLCSTCAALREQEAEA